MSSSLSALVARPPSMLSRGESICAMAGSTPGATRQYTQVPRRSEMIRPASLSFFRWWLTVGWETPTFCMSHTEASPL